MKYYSLKYKSFVKGGFGGMARYWKIEILNKYRDDEGLLEHEKFHVREWYYTGLFVLLITAGLCYFVHQNWWVLGLLAPLASGGLYRIKMYRKWSEIRAYRIQLKTGKSKGVPYWSSDFAVQALMGKYGLGMSEKEARKALGL